MRPPSCTLCGASHWTREPHLIGDVRVRPGVRRVLGSAYLSRVTVGAITADKQPKLRTITADTVTASCGHQARRPARGPLPRFCSDACRKRASRT